MSHKTNSQPRIIVIYVLLTRGGKRINMQITVSNNLIRIFYDDLINLIFTVFFSILFIFRFLFVCRFIHSFIWTCKRQTLWEQLFICVDIEIYLRLFFVWRELPNQFYSKNKYRFTWFSKFNMKMYFQHAELRKWPKY